MHMRTVSLAAILVVASAAFGYQDAGLRRSSEPATAKKPAAGPVTRSKAPTAYFPARPKTAESPPAADAKQSGSVESQPRTKTPAAGPVSPKKPSATASRAVHTEEQGRKPQGIRPAAFVDRGAEDFEAYLENSTPSRAKTAERPRVTAGRTVARPEPVPEPTAEPEFETVLPEPAVPAERKQSTKNRPLLLTQAPEGSQSPSVSLDWVSRGKFNAGQETTLELQIRNNGRVAVAGVTAEVAAPEGCDFTEITPEPQSRGERMEWELGELRPNETRSIQFRFTPREPGDVRMTAAVQITGTSGFSFSILEPKLELALEGPDSAEVGQSAGFLMRVSNPGTGTADNVVIRAKIPEGLEHRSGDTLEIEIGTLNPGESRQAQLNLSSVRGGKFAIAVEAEAEGGLSQTATAEIRVSEPKLIVAIDGPKQEMTGRSSDYRLRISNSGNVPSVNVRARYRVPDGFEFVSANRGGRYSRAENSVEWFVGTLRPEETSEFLVSLKAVRTGNVTHQAGALSENGRVTMCEHGVSVEGTAVLELQVTGGAQPVALGEECRLKVRITNSGTEVARGVGISCELPAGLELLDVAGPSEYIAENGVLVFRSLPEITADGVATYELRLKAIKQGSHRLRLRIASASLAEPLIGEETVTTAR